MMRNTKRILYIQSRFFAGHANEGMEREGASGPKTAEVKQRWTSRPNRMVACLQLMSVCLFCLIVPSGCAEKTNSSQRSMQTVMIETAPVQIEDIAVPIRGSGRLSSKTEMKLSFKTGGIIRRIAVREGDRVRNGAVLAHLDMAEIDAHVNQARSVLEKTRRDWERVKNLHQDGAASLENFENSKTAMEVAAANLRVAEFNQQHSRIVAPTSGRVLRCLVEENELIAPGMPVFLFASGEDHAWVMRVALTDRDVIGLSLGDTAHVKLDAWPDDRFQASVTELPEIALPGSGLFEVELTVDVEKRQIVSGFFARAEIMPSQKQHLYMVPVEALVEGEGKMGALFTLDDGAEKARRLRVDIATIIGSSLAIRNGLEGVSQVITTGSQYLYDGCPVVLMTKHETDAGGAEGVVTEGTESDAP